MSREITDPLPAFNFYVSLIDSSSTVSTLAGGVSLALSLGGGFTEVTGLEASLEVEDYKEGGENGFVRKFPTRATYANVVLKRGVTLSEDLWNWHYSYVTGRGKRRDGLIVLRNQFHAPVKTWVFKRGLPLKWSGPTFDAAKSAVAVESIEIAHEGVELLSAGAAVAQAVAAIF